MDETGTRKEQDKDWTGTGLKKFSGWWVGGLQVKIVSVHVLHFSFFSLCHSVYIEGTGRGARQL